MKKLNKRNLQAFIIGVFSSVLAAIIANYVWYLFTNKNAELNFEIFPISSFQSQNNSLSIVNIRIFNSGKKEAEKINGIIELENTAKILKQNVALSSRAIIYNAKTDSAKTIKIDVPILNRSEQITFSLLINSKISKKDIQVSLRGRGIQGKEYNAVDESNASQVPPILFIGTIGMTLLVIGIIIFYLIHQQKVHRFQIEMMRLEQEHIKILTRAKEKLKNSNRKNPTDKEPE